MLSEPRIENRKAQPYVAIRKTVAMMDIPKLLPPLIPQIFEWVQKQNLQQTGPVFFRYLSRDGNNVMVADVGVPVSSASEGDSNIVGDALPAGKYLVATYTGNYDVLRQAHMQMDEYAKKNGLKEAVVNNKAGERVGTRTESYVTDPAKVHDPEYWVTDLWYLVEE